MSDNQNDVIRIIKADEIEADFFSARKEALNIPEIVPVILADVRAGGDLAIRKYAARFERADPWPLEVSAEIMEEAARALRSDNRDLYDAIILSRDRALEFARRQTECFTNFETEIAPGLFAGQKNIPVETAGAYIPCGRFPLFSSVIMCAAPAKAAGVKNLIMCTPPPADSRILAAAALCGIDRVFAVGGAQAIAAMAYGTESVPRADVIVGPGNKYVAAAKKLVYGEVGIDMIAGPTDVFVIADESCDAEWTAADMLAQAEHDPEAQAVLVVAPSRRALERGAEFAREAVADAAKAVRAEIYRQLETLSTKDAARESLCRKGLVILADSLADAAELANRKAPEHLEIALDAGEERAAVASAVRNYGSLFIGHTAAEVLGDYSSGLNHTLPTSGTARFTGGLSARCFLKTATTLRAADSGDLSGVRESAQAAAVIGAAEGLAAHSAAAKKRLTKLS